MLFEGLPGKGHPGQAPKDGLVLVTWKDLEETRNTGGIHKNVREAGGQWSSLNKGRPKTGKVDKGQAVHEFVGLRMTWIVSPQKDMLDS